MTGIFSFGVICLEQFGHLDLVIKLSRLGILATKTDAKDPRDRPTKAIRNAKNGDDNPSYTVLCIRITQKPATTQPLTAAADNGDVGNAAAVAAAET